MRYTGLIIAADIAGMTGVAEGCAGEIPHFYPKHFHKPGFDVLDAVGAALGWVADTLSAPRAIGGKIYGPGEALEDNMVYLALEMPIMNPMIGNTNAESQLITKCLWGAIGGFARKRGALVRSVGVGKVRTHFIGKGNGKGDPSKAAAMDMCRALGWKPPSLDCSDAGAVWHWASTQWHPEVTVPHKHLIPEIKAKHFPEAR